MTSLRKIAVPVTCVAVICGAAIVWPLYKQKATERKLAEAASVIRARAERGDADAQYHLGRSYVHGEGVPQDYAEAVRWFRKAADQGHAKAQDGLGFIYYYGKGVPQNYTEAVRWYGKAADQGDVMALNGLAYMSAKGQGVAQDHVESVRWYRKAADQGDATAQSYLGYSYFYGLGVPQDYAESVRWYRKAAGQGDTKAQVVLGNMYRYGQGVPQDYVEAVRWYRKAADQGDKTVQAALTIIYFKGQGVPRNYTEAIRWFGKVVISCFAKTQGGSPARWTSAIVRILSLLLILVVPPRRWGRATWVPSALLSAALAATLAHELLRSEFSLALLDRGLVGTLYRGFGRILFLALLAGGSAIFAIGAVMEAVRGSKRGGDQGQPPTPMEGTLESHR